jgi:hypothetical protein
MLSGTFSGSNFPYANPNFHSKQLKTVFFDHLTGFRDSTASANASDWNITGAWHQAGFFDHFVIFKDFIASVSAGAQYIWHPASGTLSDTSTNFYFPYAGPILKSVFIDCLFLTSLLPVPVPVPRKYPASGTWHTVQKIYQLLTSLCRSNFRI